MPIKFILKHYKQFVLCRVKMLNLKFDSDEYMNSIILFITYVASNR